MAQLIAKSNCLFSNPTTKRTSCKLSKQSTGRLNFICESTRDGRQQQPPSALTSSRKYLQRYKSTLKKSQQQQPTKSQLASIVKIQRYWRFHLLMRGKVMQKVLADLELQRELLGRLERNEDVNEMSLNRQIQAVKQGNRAVVGEMLRGSKQVVMDFAQKSVVSSLGRSSHLENLRLELCYYQKELRNNLDQYQQTKEKIVNLRQNKQVLLEKERDLVQKIGNLNKTLLLENIQKSKIQLQYDELKVQNDRLRCKI